jgi:uncharacterized protein YfiM (DUF2279 family)
MKRPLFTSAAALLIFNTACCLRVPDDRWSHGVFSAAAAGAFSATMEDGCKGAAAAVGLGLLKEFLDALGGSGFCFGDLAADLAGSAAGAAGARAAMKGSTCWKR